MFAVLAQYAPSNTSAVPPNPVYSIPVALIFGLIGMSMAKKRHRSPAAGFALGFFLSFIGLIIVAIMGTKKGPPCRSCGTRLQMVGEGGSARPAQACLVCGASQIGGVAPQAAGPFIATLAAGTVLRLLEQRGDWAHVSASNGWEGWVDARRLQATGGVSTVA